MKVKKAKKKMTNRERSEFLWGWLFILPTMAGLMILNIIPIFQTIYQSFFKTGSFGRGNIFVGLENYKRLFADTAVWQALLNTLKYAIVEVPFNYNCNCTGSYVEPENAWTFCLQNDLFHAYGMCTGSGCHGVEMVI